MARRYGRRRRGRGGMKLPIISIAILAGQAAWAYYNALGWDRLDNFQSLYSGFDFTNRRFAPERLIMGYAPWFIKRIAGTVVRPRMPIRGLPFSLS